MTELAKIVLAEKLGGPEVLQVVERQLPPPGPGKVTLRVVAIGVNPIDLKILAGTRGRAAELPWQPGFEAAGVVTEVGPGVTTWRPGDEVIAFRAAGTYASALVVPEEALTAKPASLSWERAAGLLRRCTRWRPRTSVPAMSCWRTAQRARWVRSWCNWRAGRARR